MDSGENNGSNYDKNIKQLIESEKRAQAYSVLKYTAGLKALLDVLPDDVECFSASTIENYLWVIEILLQAIYDGLENTEDQED